MSSSKAVKLKPIDSGAPPVSPGSVLSGEVVAVDSGGSFTVEFPGNDLGPLPARTIVDDLWPGASVLLAFDGGDPTRPIVLGLLQPRVRGRQRTIHLKAARIVIEASEQLSLQCGEASIESARDGKLKIKGRDIVSRASRTSKIQGATVHLN